MIQILLAVLVLILIIFLVKALSASLGLSNELITVICIVVIILFLLYIFGGRLRAQVPWKNPTLIEIATCPDHALDDNHELELRLRGSGVVVGTFLLGDPAAKATGAVEFDISKQVGGLKLGEYDMRLRVKLTGAPDSDWTNVVPFDRALRLPTGFQIIK